MPVVGTAGHVDHGKSTLIQALTGRDPDRWAEEKARGLTIDLGFSWAVLPSGVEVSFVDVPGHEHFIKNMLAGIEAVDVALLVVAADEGWMPQSEEHLAVLDLLGVDRGVVALTKSDRVEDDLLELATLEVQEKLEGTSMEGAAIIPVSAHTGSGLPALTAAIDSLAAEVGEGPGGRPRMWIDRSFSISGAGTVVTGTLLDGELTIGDKVQVWPGPVDARVRGLQSHEREVVTAEPRRRVAANLAGLDRSAIERGAMLGLPGQWMASNRIATTLRAARYVTEITDRGAYHVHIGSGAWPARLRMVGEGVALFELPTPLPLRVGDHFILRDTGRRLVVGGGRVLDPAPPRHGRDIARSAVALRGAVGGSVDDIATALLAVRGNERPDVLAGHAGGGRPEGAMTVGGMYVTPERAGALISDAVALVADFHAKNPLRPGPPTATVASGLGLGAAVLEDIVSSDPRIVVEGAILRLTAFQVDRSGDDETWDRAKKTLTDAGANPPRVAELGIERDLLHALIRDGELVKISDEFVFLPTLVADLTERLGELDEGFTVSEFKDRTGLSRKYAVPFLEWTDRTGLTVRSGDVRRRLDIARRSRDREGPPPGAPS
jgi:selenocysteine-specific elongation factor